MLYLLLSILCSTFIIILFRLFPGYQVHTFQAIVFNYITCLVCGWTAMGEFPFNAKVLQVDWLPYPLVLGVIFIFTFNIAAQTVAHFGVTITSVMQRMSLLITVPFAIMFYNEPLQLLKINGLFSAVLAIVFVNIPKKQEELLLRASGTTWLWFLPFGLWLSSGFIEIALLYVERATEGKSSLLFTSLIFSTAAIIGMVYLAFQIITGRMKFHYRNVIGGMFLGLPNFGSIYFVLKTLSVGWGASVVFPVNNVAIIGLAALTGWLFFAEKLSKINILGVLLAMVAIVLIALA